MIPDNTFTVEPWHVRETNLDLNVLAQSESLFTLSNGHIGLRGNLDEGEPYSLPGTYLNSFYEVRPLPYAEAGYGYPEAGQTVVDVTNGKIVRLLVDDEPFDVRYGTLLSHERVLDLRAGTLTRSAHWPAAGGKARIARLAGISGRLRPRHRRRPSSRRGSCAGRPAGPASRCSVRCARPRRPGHAALDANAGLTSHMPGISRRAASGRAAARRSRSYGPGHRLHRC